MNANGQNARIPEVKASGHLQQIGRQLRLQGVAMEHSANGIVITDRDGLIGWTNPAFTTITGYSAEEAKGRNPRFLKSGRHDAAFYRAMWRQLAAGRTWKGTLTNRRKDGSTYVGEETISPVRDEDGTISHFVAILNDVTLRNQAQEALHSTHVQLQHLLEHSPAVVYCWKLERDTIASQFVSENIAHMLGCAAGDATAASWWQDRLHPEDREQATSSLRETAERGHSRTEYRLRDDDGGYRWIEDSRRAVPGVGGEFVGFWHDITERKRAETTVRELRAENAKRRGGRTLRDGLILAVLAVVVFFVSDTFSLFERLFQYSESQNPYFDEALGTSGFLCFGLLVFSYRRWRESQAESLCLAHMAEAMRHLQAETESKVQTRTAELAQRNDALLAEIAGRRRTEEALRLFRAQVDQSSDTFEVIDPETGRFLDVNDRGPETLGYTREEYLSLRVCDIDPTIDASAWPQIAQAIHAAGYHAGEGRHRRKDGSTFPVEYDCRWVRLDRDYFVTVIRDITVRKQAEVALQEQREQWRTLVKASASAVFVVQDDCFVLANPAAVRLLGASSEEGIIGRNIFTIIPEELQPTIRRRMQQVQAQEGPLPLLEWKARRDDGTCIDVESTSVHFQFRGQPAFLVEVRDISARKRVEAEAREAESRFRQLAENVHEVFWLTNAEKDEMLYISPAYERIWGRSCSSLLSEPHTWLNAIHSDDRQRVVGALAKQVAGTYDEEYRIIRPDESERWIRDRAFPVRDESGNVCRMAGVAEDITERKRSLSNLALQNAVTGLLAEGSSTAHTWRKILEALGDGLGWELGEFWSVDRLTKALVSAEVWHVTSPALEKFASASRNVAQEPETGLIGRVRTSACVVVSPDITHDPECPRREAAAGAGLRSWIGFPITLRGEVLGVIGFFSSRVQLADVQLLSLLTGLGAQIGQFVERQRLADQFREAQKMEAIGTLAGGIAHDFNNIIAGISGYTELAMMELSPEVTVSSYLKAVRQGADRAAALVRQIMAFSRKQEHERRLIQLGHIVKEAVSLLRATIPTTIEIKTSYAAGVPAVLADPTQVHQVVMNLCTNAWHAMKDRPGCLGVVLENCAVDAAIAETHPGLRVGSYVRLRISDTGHGMDAATLRRIFEPFFTTKPVGEGTGLGLAVVHGIMQSHEGVVTVYSAPEKGTVFDLYFPACATEVSSDVAETMNMPRGHGQRVLYIDDEPPLASMGQKILERLGYEVETRTDAMEALNAVRARPDRYDLVITDLTMPRLSGMEFTRELLTIRPDLPVILVTGYFGGLTTGKAQEMGIREVLLKPISVHALSRAVHRVLLESQPA